jgi:hypothetical protein
MEYFFKAGFLGSTASLYMDLSVAYLVLLPMFMGVAIFFAVKRNYKTHRFLQILFFILAMVSLASFNYGVHIESSLFTLMESRSVAHNSASYIMMGHTVFSLLLLVLWISTLLFALGDRRRRALPGLYSLSHKKSGRRVLLVAVFHSFSMAYCYWMIYFA